MQNPLLFSVEGVDNCFNYIKRVHNTPLQFTDEVYKIYMTFPKLIMLNIALVHHHDLYRNFKNVTVVEDSATQAIALMQEGLKDEYYIVHDLSVGNHGKVSLYLIDINDVYLTGQPLQYFRYKIIDEILQYLN